MKKEMLKRLTPLFFLLAIPLAAWGYDTLNNPQALDISLDAYTAHVRGKQLPAECTPDNALADAQTLVETLERVHPMFAPDAPGGFDERPPEGYDAAKQNFLRAAGDFEGDWDGFCLLAQEYLNTLNDGHTGVMYSRELFDLKGLLQVRWQYDSGKLWLVGPDGASTGSWVSEIGGVPVEEVFAVIDRYFAAENEPSRAQNYTECAQLDTVLRMAGVESWNLTVCDADGSERQEACSLGNRNLVARAPLPTGLYAERMGDVLYLHFDTFAPSTEKQREALDAMLADLNAFLDEGGQKVVMDVRGNGGGSDMEWAPFWQAMGFDLEGRYYSISWQRQSPELSEREEWMGMENVNEQFVELMQNPRKDRSCALAVLCDANTFSAAQNLCCAAVMQERAVLIGSPSKNAPECYTDIVRVCLPQSRLMLQISTAHRIPYDPDARRDILEPDIAVPWGGDALQAALEYFAQT